MEMINNNSFAENFKKAYANLNALHPDAMNEEFKFRYLKTDWFFPNHMHNVLEQIKLLGEKYFKNADIQICLFAGLFHDAGLVYKRESASAKGHENRSVEYAQKELKNLGYDEAFIEKVSECIKATEPDYVSQLPEALLVRNADAYAHIISMHFFAKANFTNDIHAFIKWFEDKAQSTYSKITLPDLQEEVGPVIDFYKKIIENYKRHKNENDFLEMIVQ